MSATAAATPTLGVEALARAIASSTVAPAESWRPFTRARVREADLADPSLAAEWPGPGGGQWLLSVCPQALIVSASSDL